MLEFHVRLPLNVALKPICCFRYRFDPDSLCVVARDGLTTRLLVIDYTTLEVIEQVRHIMLYDIQIISLHSVNLWVMWMHGYKVWGYTHKITG